MVPEHFRNEHSEVYSLSPLFTIKLEGTLAETLAEPDSIGVIRTNMAQSYTTTQEQRSLDGGELQTWSNETHPAATNSAATGESVPSNELYREYMTNAADAGKWSGSGSSLPLLAMSNHNTNTSMTLDHKEHEENPSFWPEYQQQVETDTTILTWSKNQQQPSLDSHPPPIRSETVAFENDAFNLEPCRVNQDELQKRDTHTAKKRKRKDEQNLNGNDVTVKSKCYVSSIIR